MGDAVINDITLERVIYERTLQCATNRFTSGVQQYDGALIVVEAREPLHV
jgi:hypothetical protein